MSTRRCAHGRGTLFRSSLRQLEQTSFPNDALTGFLGLSIQGPAHHATLNIMFWGMRPEVIGGIVIYKQRSRSRRSGIGVGNTEVIPEGRSANEASVSGDFVIGLRWSG